MAINLAFQQDFLHNQRKGQSTGVLLAYQGVCARCDHPSLSHTFIDCTILVTHLHFTIPLVTHSQIVPSWFSPTTTADWCKLQTVEYIIMNCGQL